MIDSPIPTEQAKKALASYIKGLVQDFCNETGLPIASIELSHKVEDGRRLITEVKVLTDFETPVIL